MEDGSDVDALVAALQATGDYRVLRRLQPRRQIEATDGSAVRLGIFLDVETTGLDPYRDEIIELAMVPFTYGLDGRIFEIGEPFSKLREPTKPIPPEITLLTGIDDEMVRGHVIDPAEVTSFVAPAALIVAHNANFDRKFVERYCETFSTKPWACSMSQVDWAREGHDGVKLTYLAVGSGFFYERHRALQDCHAALELLASPQPRSGRRPMTQLLERARQPTWRIWAENSPFELKDVLKARGYRWNAEVASSPRAWYVDVDDGQREAELSFLSREIYQREIDLLVKRVDAHDRFSMRC